jgi:6-phosphogluconate dehydrogenase (decarboxylating)
MASHLLKAGFAVAVYDVQPAAIERIVADGASAMGSPRDVAERSEVIIVMVVDDEQTTAVVAGPDGLLEGARPGTVVILCSSLRPSTVHNLQAIAQPRGVEIADAPVTGGERGAIDGKLTFLVGASPATFERIRPVLQAMGPTAEHVGPAGSGQVVKVVHNVLLWAELAATSEALQPLLPRLDDPSRPRLPPGRRQLDQACAVAGVDERHVLRVAGRIFRPPVLSLTVRGSPRPAFDPCRTGRGRRVRSAATCHGLVPSL